MRISVDLDKRTLSVTTATGLLDPSSSSSIVPVQQGDSYGVEIVFIKDEAQAELPSPYTTISFGAVPKLTPTSALLFFSESFTLTGTGTTSVYTSLIEFDTTEIEDYFASLGSTAIIFDALLQVRISDGTEDNQQTISGLWPVEVSRNILENSTPAGTGRSINLTWRPSTLASVDLKAIPTAGSIAVNAAIIVNYSPFTWEQVSMWVLTIASGDETETDERLMPNDYDISTNDKAWVKKAISGDAQVDAGNLIGSTLAGGVLYSSLTTVGMLTALSVDSTFGISINSTVDFECTASTFSFGGAANGTNLSIDDVGQQVNVTAANGFYIQGSLALVEGSELSQLNTFSSADLISSLTDKTGTGLAVFDTTPTFKTSVRVNNPGNTFYYALTPAAIAANRILNLPLITATDTLATLGLAQIWTGVQTFSNPIAVGSGGTGLSAFGTGTALLLADQMAEDLCTWRDDFIGGTNTAGVIGQLGWRLTTTGAITDNTTDCLYIQSETNHPGIYRIQTGIVSGLSKALILAGSSQAQIPVQTGTKLRVLFRVNSVTDVGFSIILANDAGSFSTDANAPTRYFGLRADTSSGDTLFYAVCKNAGSETKTSTGVAFAVGWHMLTLEVTGSSSSGTVTLDAATPVALNSNFFGGTEMGILTVAVVTRTTSAKTMDIDFVSVVMPLTR